MTKEKIIRRFNKSAKTYEAAIDIQLMAAQQLSSYLNRPANHIMEIGCGTGAFSRYLIERFKDKPILLTDIAAEMIKTTQNRFASSANVSTAYQDGENLSISSKYDLVASNMVFHWFNHMAKSIQNILEQLKSGGYFVFSLLGQSSLREWREVFLEHKHAPDTLNFISCEELRAQFPTMQFKVEKYVVNYASAYAFLRTLRNIGGTASYAQSQLSAAKLRSLLRQCRTPFPVTYEIIYGSYIKP